MTSKHIVIAAGFGLAVALGSMPAPQSSILVSVAEAQSETHQYLLAVSGMT